MLFGKVARYVRDLSSPTRKSPWQVNKVGGYNDGERERERANTVFVCLVDVGKTFIA